MQITTSTDAPTLKYKHGLRKANIVKTINSQRHRIGTQKMKQNKADEILNYLENKFGVDNENIDLTIEKFALGIKERKMDIIEKGLTAEQMFGNM